MKNSPIISITKMKKQFSEGKGKFTALENINLSFEKGEFTGIVGPSGSGKTTLLNIIGSLDSPTEGEVITLGESIGKLTHKKAANLRNHNIGFIFQTYNLLPVYSVYENVEFPLLLLKMPAKKRKEAVLNSLEWLGLTDKIKSRPGQLSGGECQRVAVARAMVKLPEIVLADEPTANLDAENSHNILKMMVKLNKELNTTFIFATHDDKVRQYLKREVVLKDGRVKKVD
ncbi:MAG: ABC transporter ATP-binding protein [Candidatus Marinimicrobia bacterium]|nr:ABC transporter ATP-binding protein [Candidatus Neomarinimicrobiota bacterium]